MKIKLIKTKKNEWYFKFVASNGRTLCHSETYKRIKGAEKGLQSILKNLPSATIEIIE